MESQARHSEVVSDWLYSNLTSKGYERLREVAFHVISTYDENCDFALIPAILQFELSKKFHDFARENPAKVWSFWADTETLLYTSADTEQDLLSFVKKENLES